jgi:dihydroorotate dehydrogenase electron transfer subunit
MLQVFGHVVRHEKLLEAVYYLTIKVPEIASVALPGQFVQARCSEGYAPLLRKPLSIHEIDKQSETISLLYEVKGQGTKLLTNFKSGDTIDLIGPLGNGFTLPQKGKSLLVGGGMGIAPLLPLAQKLMEQGHEFTTILGFNDKERVCRLKAFQEQGQVIVATMDGSLGEKGLVTKPLTRELETGKYSTVYACGPEGMLKSVTYIAGKFEINCQVSLEAYMACGFGACLGCSCQTETLTGLTYSRVCTEGPVFNSKEVVWHES